MARYTKDLDDDFFAEVDAMCARLQCDKGDVLRVMQSESGVSASKRNLYSSATGLIQFMADKKGRYFGRTRDEFGALSATDQLIYVERHFRPYVGRLNNVAAVYLAVFMPAQIELANDNDAVVVGKDGPYGWAFEANAYFDFDGDLKIRTGELIMSVDRQCVGPRWAEVAERAGIDPGTVAPTTYDLRSVLGVQRALALVGFDPGPIDGFAGPRTTSALRLFQIANGLEPVGVPGPKTRAALRHAVGSRGLKAIG